MGKLITLLFLVSGGFVAFFLNKHFGVTPEVPDIGDGYFGSGRQKPDSDKIEPFTIQVPDTVIEDLNNRLDRTRSFHPLEDVRSFEYGINTDFLETVRKHWRSVYDWKKYENILNQYPHFKTEIEGMKVHFIHAKPPSEKKKKVVPLLMVHGWPGSVWEFYKIIPFLVDPPPSMLPPGFSQISTARVFGKLMKRLKHNKYYLQGGDWGAIITTFMAQLYPERVLGLHSNMPTVAAHEYPVLFVKQLVGTVMPSLVLDPEDYSKVYPMGERFVQLLKETGYFHIQATRPDTVGFGLNDSPLGLAGYILEKFSVWTNPAYKELDDGGLVRHWTLDELLTNVMIYWTTGTIATSQRFYKEYFRDPHAFVFEKIPVVVPTGVAICPNELAKMPRNFLEYKYRNITSYTDMRRCGHFAAFEEPKLFATDIFGFVGELEA